MESMQLPLTYSNIFPLCKLSLITNFSFRGSSLPSPFPLFILLSAFFPSSPRQDVFSLHYFYRRARQPGNTTTQLRNLLPQSHCVGIVTLGRESLPAIIVSVILVVNPTICTATSLGRYQKTANQTNSELQSAESVRVAKHMTDSQSISNLNPYLFYLNTISLIYNIYFILILFSPQLFLSFPANTLPRHRYVFPVLVAICPNILSISPAQRVPARETDTLITMLRIASMLSIS